MMEDQVYTTPDLHNTVLIGFLSVVKYICSYTCMLNVVQTHPYRSTYFSMSVTVLATCTYVHTCAYVCTCTYVYVANVVQCVNLNSNITDYCVSQRNFHEGTKQCP